MKLNPIPEIIAPGGSYTKALVAARQGAEAVYLGVPYTSLRMRQNKVSDFDLLKKTIAELHRLGTRAYLTMNIFPRNMDIKIFESIVENIKDSGADAIIFSDPGTFSIIRKHLPDIPLHMSTQANMLNYEAVKFWYDLGVKRIVLARELTLKEIKEIKEKVPEMELEIFVHGAMCITYSGRCLMGEYFAGRDGNKGECAHVCRYNFKMYVEEEKRPGKLFELKQGEHGWSYMMSSKDLCSIERLAELLPYVDGLKIEGRSKSEYYVGATVTAYRHVRDAIINEKPVDEALKQLVYDMPHRPYWDGFLFNSIRSAPDGEENNIGDESYLQDGDAGVTKTISWPVAATEYCGLVQSESRIHDGKTYHLFQPKQKIMVGEELHCLTPKGIHTVTITDVMDTNDVSKDHMTCNMNNLAITAEPALEWREILYRYIPEEKRKAGTGEIQTCSCH